VELETVRPAENGRNQEEKQEFVVDGHKIKRFTIHNPHASRVF
jgi:hypothetical protein